MCVIACVASPCLFVSCDQRSDEHPLSNLCLCQRRPTAPVDNADCVTRVIPSHHQQQQQPPKVTCPDCSRPRLVCHCGFHDRRQRRTATCRGLCGRHERRAAAAGPTGNDKCRNGGTPNGLNADCQCRAGFFGDRCQLLDPCREQPCRNGGYCRSLVDLTGAGSASVL